MGSTQARTYHSVIFGDKNSWDDWHLIPASRPEFAPPKGRTMFAEIPGHPGGGIDISQINIAHPMYENRKGSLQFIVANGYGDWQTRYDTIRNYLHGQTMRAILEDEPNFYYEGRFKVKPWSTGKDYSTITIDYNVDPYKREILMSTEPWLWDPFDFVYGIIQDTGNITVTNQKTFTLENQYEPYSPYITCSAAMDVTLNGTLFHLPAGRSRNPLMVLQSGINTYIFHGTGTVSIEHRGGML